MNPEIKAKVDEFLKACGARELTMDEMDKVSGGQQNESIGGVLHSHEEIDAYCKMIDDIEKSFGRDVAIEVSMGYLPIPQTEEYMRAKGAQGLGKLLHGLLEADTDTLAGRYSY